MGLSNTCDKKHAFATKLLHFAGKNKYLHGLEDGLEWDSNATNHLAGGFDRGIDSGLDSGK